MEKIITMRRDRGSFFKKIKNFFTKRKQLLAAVFIVASSLVAMPGTKFLLAQKIIPTVQTQNNQFVSDKAEVKAAGGQTPTEQNTYSPVNTIQNNNGWRSLGYEQLINYTPSPQDSGEYITFLLKRTSERYDEIRSMNLSQEEKIVVSKNIQKRTSAQLRKVEKIIAQHLKTLAILK